MSGLLLVKDILTEADQKKVNEFMPEDPPIQGMTQLMVSFVDQLLITKGNRTQSYKNAGYAVKNDNCAGVGAYELLKKPSVQKYLAWRLNQLAKFEMVEINQHKVIRELNRLAYSSIDDFCTWDEDGAITLKDMDDLTHDAIAAIKKIKSTRTTRTNKHGATTVTVVTEVEAHDKKGPLELLARAGKLVGDKGAASVPITVNMNFGKDKGDVKGKASRVVSEQ